LNIINNNSLTAGFFGKLPKFADFVKLNASGSELAVIDQWLQEGLATAKLKYKNDWRTFYQSTPPINFIYPFTGTDKIIVGTIYPSNDKSGRSFPFILFGNLNRRIVSSLKIHLTILEFEGLFKYFESIFQTHCQNEDLDEMKSLVDNFSNASLIRSSVENAYRDYLAKNSVKSIFNFDSKEMNQFENISVNNLLMNRFSYLENAPGIRFSFNTGEDNDIMKLSFITEFLLKYFGRDDHLPALFWSGRESNTILLYIFFQKPTPGNFLDMLYSKEHFTQNIPVNTEAGFSEPGKIHKDMSLNEILTNFEKNIT